MTKSFFEVIRPGINTTFQDLGRKNLNHIGIGPSGVMDRRNYFLANKILSNDFNSPIIEFAYQGPKLKYNGDKVTCVITGEVNFVINQKDNVTKGICYNSFTLDNGDELDIISTVKSVYGYFSISGLFKVDYQWDSCSTSVKAKIGANNGEKLKVGQKIEINQLKNVSNRNLNYTNTKIENIRVIKGTNFEYFSENAVKNFFSKEFLVTKLTDRMGMRLEGEKLENLVDSNIKSEGLVKGVIQVPTDGNLIIMLADHGTIGGYPKIATVISADFDKLVQMSPGSRIKFKEVSLTDAETLFKLYEMETQNLLSQI